MPAPVRIQTSSLGTGNGTATVTLSGVTAGSTIVVLVTQGASGVRTYSATGYSVAVTNNSSRCSAILYRENVSSGSHSITVNANTGTLGITIIAVEFSACTYETSSSFTDSTSVTNHPCAASGAIDSASNSLIVSGGILNASGTTLTKHSTATQIYADTTILWQFETSNSGFVDESHDWTSSTARIAQCVIASFVASGGETSLTSTNITTGSPTVDALTLNQTHTLVANAITADQPTITNLVLNQTHTLATNSISANAPTVDSLILNQTHNLVANAINAGSPVVASLVLNQTHTLAPNTITTGQPVVDAITLGSGSTLVPNAINAGQPTVANLVLNQTHTLVATAINAGSPTVDSLVLNQTHTLVASPISTGSPTIDSLVLGGVVIVGFTRNITVNSQTIVVYSQNLKI